ncbi:MAG: TIGR00300 family protein [Armatimonadetes bacterium]|nr:TIGR00300 family protein [Armatimonadota bacterium]
MISERIRLEGEVLSNQRLNRIAEILHEHGVRVQVTFLRLGEPSVAELHLEASTPDQLDKALLECEPLSPVYSRAQAQLAVADMDGVLPEDFHSTTNFPTYVQIDSNWIPVERLEMDCGIKVWQEGGKWRAITCPMHRVKAGDSLVVGMDGVRVTTETELGDEADAFRFMSSDVSSERPKARMIEECAEAMRHAKSQGKDVLLVGGPAIIHSGCAEVLAALIRSKWITVLFAGNALAAHDIEASMMGTSLGVQLATGMSLHHGHTHHLRAINRVRRVGSIRAAVEAGIIPGGAMHACITSGTPYVLAGSIRDDGPLPDVITDVVKATDAMRENVQNVGVALMVATTLHSVATGNIIPAAVVTYCVDSDADTVIKLTDRGTHQAIGIVTDCEFFMKELARTLGVI